MAAECAFVVAILSIFASSLCYDNTDDAAVWPEDSPHRFGIADPTSEVIPDCFLCSRSSFLAQGKLFSLTCRPRVASIFPTANSWKTNASSRGYGLLHASTFTTLLVDIFILLSKDKSHFGSTRLHCECYDYLQNGRGVLTTVWL